MCEFLLTTYLLRSEEVFFNRLSAFQWNQTVPLYLPNCFFIIMRLTSCRNFLGRKIRSQQYPNSTFRYIDDVHSFWNFGSSMLFNFVIVWLYKYFDMASLMSLMQTKRASGVLNYNPGTFDNYMLQLFRVEHMQAYQSKR